MSLTPELMQHDQTVSKAVCCPAFIKYFEGYTCREIAGMLQLPISTVRENIRSSKRLLRKNYHSYNQEFTTEKHQQELH